MPDTIAACPWCGNDPLYRDYHDNVWGRPIYNRRELFEKLCLDGQQAGLSWLTILRKQTTYQAAYDGFDPNKIVYYDAQKIASLLSDPGIIRNRLKVQSIILNARGYLQLEAQGTDFAEFLWGFVGGKAKQNSFTSMHEVPALTVESEAMSKALKKRGFTFVGPTICYAFMQAVGMVNDHLTGCPKWQVCHELAQMR